jgi:hypothetical protein
MQAWFGAFEQYSKRLFLLKMKILKMKILEAFICFRIPSL